LEWAELSYKKYLISLKAFLGQTNAGIVDVIKICNLVNLDHWSLWSDDFGNILQITDKKDFTIKLNPNPDSQIINTRDLYSKAHIKNLVTFSKFALISVSHNSYFIWLLDNSDILRLYSYVDNIYIGSQPVLLSSVDTLKKIIRNLNVEKFQEIFHITEPTSKEEVVQSWATQLPMDEKLLVILPEILQKDLSFNAER